MTYKTLAFFFLSTFKYAMTIPPIVALYDYKETLLISIGGGLFGILFFRFVWAFLIRLWNSYIRRKYPDSGDRIKINKRRRYIVKVKNKYGFWGTIVLTPVFLSIPLGVFILQRYFKTQKNKYSILSAMLIIWGTVIITILHQIKDSEVFHFLTRF